MGVTWALGWGLTGVLIGVVSKLTPFLPWAEFFRVFDAPLPAMAVPGFVGGVFFSIVLGLAGRGRKFSDLSLAKFTAWGALGGVLLSLFPAALVSLGLASLHNPEEMGLTRITLTILGPLTLLSAASAAGYLKLARAAEQRHDAAVG